MDLEVQVRVDAVRVARVADVSHLLARGDAGTVLDGVRRSADALAAVVVARRQVVVEVDVVVRRAALSVEVEHAAGSRRGRPVLHLAGFSGDRR